MGPLSSGKPDTSAEDTHMVLRASGEAIGEDKGVADQAVWEGELWSRHLSREPAQSGLSLLLCLLGG